MNGVCKKIFLILLSGVFLIMNVGGCSGKKQTEVVAGRVVTENGVTYIEADGKPFTYVGIQLRTDAFMNCEFKKAEDLEPYFKATAALNINTIQLPIDWRDIESDKDRYDFSVIDSFLSMAKKYNLKVEFLWFSTNMCGETHSYHIPDYIIDDAKTYPRYDTQYTGLFWKYYGYIMHLEFGNDALLEREVKVVTKLMEYVYEWNEKNGKPNTLIGVQVHNEPDCFPLWRVGHNQIYVKKDGEQITEQQAIADVNKALDTVGKAFKSSPYKIYTRVNFALANVMNDYIKSVFDLEGIDIVGDDPHEENVATISNAIKEYSLVGNYPHIAENRASYSNTNSLILNAFAQNGGYIMYEVATSEFFVTNNSDPKTDPEYGIYKADLSPKQHTASVGRFLKMLNNIGSALVTTDKVNIVAFNVENNFPLGTYEKKFKIGENEWMFKTEKSAIGVLIDCGNYVIVASEKEAELQGVNDATCEQGVFDGDEWIKQNDIVLTNGSFKLEGYCIYKIGVTK